MNRMVGVMAALYIGLLCLTVWNTVGVASNAQQIGRVQTHLTQSRAISKGEHKELADLIVKTCAPNNKSRTS